MVGRGCFSLFQTYRRVAFEDRVFIKYQISVPVYLSTHYFYLDKRFSPYVNLRLGGFAMFNAKNVGTNEKYSISKEKQGFSLFVSPCIGVKFHFSNDIGIIASVLDDNYLIKAYLAV